MIDIATRFSRAAIIHSKEKKVIGDKLIESWIGTSLGIPKKIMCDNGGEWMNNEFMDFCEYMNIRVMTTAAESPLSNGICERNHAVIDESVRKIRADQPDCVLTVAPAWWGAIVPFSWSLVVIPGYQV